MLALVTASQIASASAASVLDAEPILARGRYISALLLAGVGGLFLCVWPCRSRNLHTAVLANAAFLPQLLDHLVKRRVGRLCKRAENEIRMPVKYGPLRLALFGRANFPRCPLQPRPCPGRRYPDRKPLRRLTRRYPPSIAETTRSRKSMLYGLPIPSSRLSRKDGISIRTSRESPPTRFLGNRL
jgi:hypothetical protein